MSTTLKKKTKTPEPAPVDVEWRGEGSMYQVRAVTKTAKDWVAENVQLEGWQYMGEWFAVEHRYIDNLVTGMLDAGLNVERV